MKPVRPAFSNSLRRAMLGTRPMVDLVHDEIIVFPQLKYLEFEKLPNLKSFCCCTHGSKKQEEDSVEHNIPRVEALFNHEVRFPALKELYIKNLESVTAIWDNQLFLGSETQDSFGQLRLVEVFDCEKLVNVIPPNVIPMLQNLESLKVAFCYSMVCGVEVAAIEEGSNEILMFPKLKIMRLEKLPKLSSFCYSRRGGEDSVVESNIPQPQALFNHKVKFPCLEDLEIIKLDLKEIWHNTISTDSVSKLRNLELKWCHKLLNVASTDTLSSFQNLEELQVLQCDSLQEVFKVEGLKGAEGTVASDKAIGKEVENKIVFPQLKKVVFEELPCLTSFYEDNCISELPSSLTMEIKRCPILKMFPCRYLNTVALKTVGGPLQPFQNEKVEFPILEKLVLCDGSMLEAIWHGHIPAGSFCKVRFLEAKRYSNLVNASTLLQWFEVVEELIVKSCYSLEVIFYLEGPDAIERKAIPSSQTKELRLFDLPELERIWITDPMQGLLVFHNLTSLTVKKCNSLSYVFSLSIARGLTQLRKLDIGRCNAMEEIVKSEGQGEEDDTEEIVFSQLEHLGLRYLPNLISFSGANNAFKFSSLKEVTLLKCANLQTFASGGISTPDISVHGDWEDYAWLSNVSNLNDYVKKEYGRKGKGLAVDNDDEENKY